jgi:hypothetical protein
MTLQRKMSPLTSQFINSLLNLFEARVHEPTTHLATPDLSPMIVSHHQIDQTIAQGLEAPMTASKTAQDKVMIKIRAINAPIWMIKAALDKLLLQDLVRISLLSLKGMTIDLLIIIIIIIIVIIMAITSDLANLNVASKIVAINQEKKEGLLHQSIWQSILLPCHLLPTH